MIEHYWTIVCSRSIIDGDSNKISIIDAIEQLNVVGPIQVEEEQIEIAISFEIVSLWGRSKYDQPCRGEGKVEFVSPSDEVLRFHNFEIDLSEFRRMRTIGRLHGIPVKSEGVYSFKVYTRIHEENSWNYHTRVPLHVIYSPAEETDK